MKINYKQWTALLMASFLGSNLMAEESEPALKVGGRVWAFYNLDMTEGAGHKNGFDISRAYLQAKYKYDATWSAIVLLDHERNKLGTSGTPDTWVYVRNAYVQGSNLFDSNTSFRFGLQPTLYISKVDAAVKTRWLGKSLADESGYLKSQEGGASLFGSFADKFEYGLMVHNGGESLSKSGASDSALGTTVQLAYAPFKGSDGVFDGLSFLVSNTLFSDSKSTRSSSNVLTAALLLEHSALDLALEYIMKKLDYSGAKVAHGYGLIANVKAVKDLSIYGRLYSGNDKFKQDYEAEYLATVGPTYTFVEDKLSTAVLYERKGIEDSPDSQVVYWNWAASF